MEVERIRPYFKKELPEYKMEIIEPLIQNMAFMKVTLEDLQEKVLLEPVKYEYRKGESKNDLSDNLKLYNSLIKSYSTLAKNMIHLISECKNSLNIFDYLK